jgi:uncharacterized membrane protein YfcA
VTIAFAVIAGVGLGLMLGLLGGGGGIIAIPVLLALGESVDAASTTSLVVVGIGAAAGLVMHRFTGRVAWRLGFVFGVLGALGAIVGSRLAFIADDRLQLAGFIGLLALAAWRMFHQVHEAPPEAAIRWLRVFLFATLVGLITGFFGVGGGFVAVPALVLAMRMPIKIASSTALLVILVNVSVAFIAHGTSHVDPMLTVTISSTAAVGAVIGALLQARISPKRLQRAFALLLALAAAYSLYELIAAF